MRRAPALEATIVIICHPADRKFCTARESHHAIGVAVFDACAVESRTSTAINGAVTSAPTVDAEHVAAMPEMRNVNFFRIEFRCAFALLRNNLNEGSRQYRWNNHYRPHREGNTRSSWWRQRLSRLGDLTVSSSYRNSQRVAARDAFCGCSRPGRRAAPSALVAFAPSIARATTATTVNVLQNFI